MVWTTRGNIRGPQGAQGPTGAQGPQGPAGPALRPPVDVPYAATITLDASAGNLFRVPATGNPTFAAPTNPSDGQVIVVEFTASGGARTATLVTGSAGAWAFGTDATAVTALTATTSGLTDFWQAVYRASVNRWRVIGYSKGY